jgi:hypothetical protein
LGPLLRAQSIRPENGGFMQPALSVITTILPSEKTTEADGTYLKNKYAAGD